MRKSFQVLCIALTCGGTGTAVAQYAELVSGAPNALFFDRQASRDARGCDLSGTGRYVAFQSAAGNLVADDSNGVEDVFVLDRDTGEVRRVSVDSAGGQANGSSARPAISGNGRFVAFSSSADNLVAGDTNGASDVFVHDLQSGTTIRAGLADNGSEPPSGSVDPSISNDGSRVAFISDDPLVAGDGNGEADAFVRDLGLGVTIRASVNAFGAEGNDGTFNAAISGDGRVVAFESTATNLVPGDTNGERDIFIRDINAGTTIRVLADGGAQPDDDADIESISNDGSVVTFSSRATNYVAGDANDDRDVFVFDAAAGMVELVSEAMGGGSGAGFSQGSAVSGTGRYVAFESAAGDLVAADTNPDRDVFRLDRDTGVIELASVSTSGAQPAALTLDPCISGDGARVGFSTDAELVAGDGNLQRDVHVRNVGAGTTVRISDADAGGPYPVHTGNEASGVPAVSADGRYVALESRAVNFTGDDPGPWTLIYRIDRETGAAELASPPMNPGPADAASEEPSISGDGTRIAFESRLADLVVGDTNDATDVFVRDFGAGATRRVSVDSIGTEGNGASENASISGDGAFVAFQSSADNLVSGDGNGRSDVFVHELATGETLRVSIDSFGAEANAASEFPDISGDGRYVVFQSDADNLSPQDSNPFPDVYRHDRDTQTTELVSVGLDGTSGNGISSRPEISADGRYVAFVSFAGDLVAGDTNGTSDVFVRDMVAGTTALVSVDPQGNPFGSSSAEPSISDDGSVVAFSNQVSIAGPDAFESDVYAYDLGTATTLLMSRNRGGVRANGNSALPAVSGDGRVVVFESEATNLDGRDVNGERDLYAASPDDLFEDSFEPF